MKLPVFISWSGARSKLVASALRSWLPQVLQNADPWMSTDIPSGKSWFAEIGVQLERSKFGVICVTPENQASPWLNFEAGACAKLIAGASCCPYLFDLGTTDLKPPLGQFHVKQATKEGTRDLIVDINKSLGSNDAVAESMLAAIFEKWWDDLEGALKSIPADDTQNSNRSTDDMIREILDIVRSDRPAPTLLADLVRGMTPYQPGDMATLDASYRRLVKQTGIYPAFVTEEERDKKERTKTAEGKPAKIETSDSSESKRRK